MKTRSVFTCYFHFSMQLSISENLMNHKWIRACTPAIFIIDSCARYVIRWFIDQKQTTNSNKLCKKKPQKSQLLLHFRFVTLNQNFDSFLDDIYLHKRADFIFLCFSTRNCKLWPFFVRCEPKIYKKFHFISTNTKIKLFV